MSRFLTRTKLVLSGTLLMVPLVSATAFAATTPTTATTPTPTTTVAPATPSSAPTETAQDRITARVAALKVKLTTVEQKRLTTRCQGAQAVVKVLDTKLATAIDNRTKAYTAIDHNLTTLSNRLTKQNIDVSTITEQQATFKTMSQKLKTDAAAYQLALQDLHGMDCAKDPAGFKASLEAARTMHTNLVKEAADVRAYIVTTLSGTLEQISNRLGAAASSTSNSVQ